MAKKFTLTQDGEKLEPIFSPDGAIRLDEIVESVLPQYLPLTELVPRVGQPRTNFDNKELNELSESIKQIGIIQPILVRKISDKRYEIIAGERRWRAAKIAELESIPVIVKDYNDADLSVVAIVENIQRADLSPLEEAYAFEKLIQNFKFTHEEIAKRVGRSRSSISNVLRLLELSEAVKIALNRKQIEMGHARALLSLDFDEQKKILEEIIFNNLTVRQVEKLVASEKMVNKEVNAPSKPIEMMLLEKKLKNIFNIASISFKISPNGKIRTTIDFNSIIEADTFFKGLM